LLGVSVPKRSRPFGGAKKKGNDKDLGGKFIFTNGNISEKLVIVLQLSRKLDTVSFSYIYIHIFLVSPN